MRVLTIFSILVFLSVSILQAQSVDTIDQLQAKISDAVTGSQKVRLLTQLAERLIDKGAIDSAQTTLRQADSLSRNAGFHEGHQLVSLSRASLYLVKLEPDSARLVLVSALQRYPATPLANKFYNHLGTASRFLGKNEEALAYYEKALANSDTAEDAQALAAIKQNMAVVYQNMGNKAKALEQYLDGLAYAESVKDTVFLATLLNNIGESYTDYEEYDKAGHYLQRSIELSQAIGFKVGVLRASFNMANVKNNTGELDTALSLYEKSLKLSSEIRPGQPPVRINHNLGRLYQKMGDLERSEEYFRQSLSQSEAMNLIQGVYYNSKGLGGVATERGNLAEAVTWYKKALEAAEQLGSASFVKEAHQDLYLAYKQQGSGEQALKHLESYQAVTDSLNQRDRAQALAEQEAKLNMHRQEEINRLLEARQREQQSRLNLQQWLLVGGLLVIVLILGMVAVLVKVNRDRQKANRQLERQKQELEHLNQVKSKLFAIVAHDLRNPLSGLKGMLYLFRENDISEEELKAMFAHLELSMEHSLNIMENLLVWAREQLDGITINLKPVGAEAVVEEVFRSQSFHAGQKQITLTNNVAAQIRVQADQDLLELVLRNLVSNSLKFSKNGGEVRVDAVLTNEQIVFSVQDSGIGIPDREKGTLFQVGHKTRKGTGNEHGSGLGLNMCKEFIEKQNGRIWFESEEGRGTTFYFSLPKAHENIPEIELKA
jgi:signal transduction histidine kinase